MSKNPRKLIGESVLLLVTLIWGATFVIVKESLNDISSMLFLASRFSIAALFVLPFFISKKRDLKWTAVKGGFILGIFLFAGFAAQTVGLQYTTATKSGFITGSSVVMIPVLQTIIEKRKPTMGTTLGVILVFIGILFLSSGGNSIFTFLSELGSSFNFGDFMTLICALFFALYIVYLDIISTKYDFWTLVFVQIIVTALASFFFSFLFSAANIEPMRIVYSEYLLFGLLYTALLATLVTTILQTRYQREVTPTKAGIIFAFEPIFAAVFAFFLLNEKISNFGLIGSLMIFLGLVISETYESWVKNYAVKSKES
ncbi:MAG: DMT family transporter [Melioribacteraceae bacterium]|nr:DMT family transporter [Melioribacteraceae bacterium]